MPVPDGHLDSEAAALRAFGGNGCVTLLRDDPARGALLLERAPSPGTGLPHVRDELAEFETHLARFPGDDPIPRRTVERAAELFRDLCDSSPGDVVLHGDLHHANVLRARRREWLAIDPHGRVGDPGYDCGQLLHNPGHAEGHLPDLAPRRVEQIADGLGMPVERVRAWGFAVCVLSEVWTASDGEGVDGVPLAVAHRLEADL